MPYLGETVNTYCVSFLIFCKKILRMGKVYDILPIKEVIFLSVLNDRIKEQRLKRGLTLLQVAKLKTSSTRQLFNWQSYFIPLPPISWDGKTIMPMYSRSPISNRRRKRIKYLVSAPLLAGLRLPQYKTLIPMMMFPTIFTAILPCLSLIHI